MPRLRSRQRRKRCDRDQLMVRPQSYPLFDKQLFVCFVLLVPVALGSASGIFNDGDVSWHIATGQWILAHGQVPRVDPFSFTMNGHPWVAYEWLAEVIYAAGFNFAGYAGVSAIVILAMMILHGIVFAHLRPKVGPVAFLLAFMAMDVALVPFLLARPHVLVWPILAGWTALLLRARDEARPPPWAAALLMLLWANLHGSFVFGLCHRRRHRIGCADHGALGTRSAGAVDWFWAAEPRCRAAQCQRSCRHPSSADRGGHGQLAFDFRSGNRARHSKLRGSSPSLRPSLQRCSSGECARSRASSHCWC